MSADEENEQQLTPNAEEDHNGTHSPPSQVVVNHPLINPLLIPSKERPARQRKEKKANKRMREMEKELKII